jgi:hypothetical protein
MTRDAALGSTQKLINKLLSANKDTSNLEYYIYAKKIKYIKIIYFKIISKRQFIILIKLVYFRHLNFTQNIQL